MSFFRIPQLSYICIHISKHQIKYNNLFYLYNNITAEHNNNINNNYLERISSIPNLVNLENLNSFSNGSSFIGLVSPCIGKQLVERIMGLVFPCTGKLLVERIMGLVSPCTPKLLVERIPHTDP